MRGRAWARAPSLKYFSGPQIFLHPQIHLLQIEDVLIRAYFGTQRGRKPVSPLRGLYWLLRLKGDEISAELGDAPGTDLLRKEVSFLHPRFSHFNDIF